MKKFVIVIPSYNNSKWYERNLSSVLSQNYPNYSIVYTDDCSPDGTGKLVKEYLEKHSLTDKVKLTLNETRKGAMHNLYDMIHACDDDEIVVTVDGDDTLAHPEVINRLNVEYENNNVKMTYGSYVDWPGKTRGCSKPVPRNIIDTNSYRRHPWCFSHLRTFEAWLFKQLPASDFQINGKWMMSAWDLPIMFGLAELSGGRFKYIPDVLYLYNNENPISDYKVRLKEQQTFERIVRSRKPYKAIV